MRTIKELVKDKSKVWVLIDSKELVDAFLKQVKNEEFQYFYDSSYPPVKGQYFFSIRNGKKIESLNPLYFGRLIIRFI